MQTSTACHRVSFYLAIRRSFGAGAGRCLSLYLWSGLRNPHPDKVDDMVQIGEEIGAWEPAVVTVLLNARLLNKKKGRRRRRQWLTEKLVGTRGLDSEESGYKLNQANYLTSSSLLSWIWLSKPSSIRYSTMHSTCSDMFWWSIQI